MNRIRSFLAGIAIGVVGLGIAVAAPIVGPQDPARFIAQLNENLLNWMSYPSANQGELQLLGPNAFAGLGTVATSVTSLGPVGAATTVQRWMIVINPAGTVGYVPVF